MDVSSSTESSNLALTGALAAPSSAPSSAHSQSAPATALPPSDGHSQALTEINRQLSLSNRELDFSIDKESGITIVCVLDGDTQQVISQFPAEEVIRVAHALGKFKGLFVTQTV